jgi:DNA-binding response OmpR family regulator
VVLLVDDDPGIRELYATWLADEWTPLTAGTAGDAEAALDSPLVAAVLDRELPGSSGEALLRQVRSRHPGLPVAFVSVHDPDCDALRLGADDYLHKPATAAELRNLVTAIARRGHLEPDRRRLAALLSLRDAFRRSAGPDALEGREAIRAELDRLATVASDDGERDPRGAPDADGGPREGGSGPCGRDSEPLGDNPGPDGSDPGPAGEDPKPGRNGSGPGPSGTGSGGGRGSDPRRDPVPASVAATLRPGVLDRDEDPAR